VNEISFCFGMKCDAFQRGRERSLLNTSSAGIGWTAPERNSS
jgi:hypothetical protein